MPCAPQIDDGANPEARCRLDLVWRGLGGPPRLAAETMLVEVEQPENTVIHQ